MCDSPEQRTSRHNSVAVVGVSLAKHGLFRAATRCTEACCGDGAGAATPLSLAVARPHGATRYLQRSRMASRLKVNGGRPPATKTRVDPKSGGASSGTRPVEVVDHVVVSILPRFQQVHAMFRKCVRIPDCHGSWCLLVIAAASVLCVPQVRQERARTHLEVRISRFVNEDGASHVRPPVQLTGTGIRHQQHRQDQLSGVYSQGGSDSGASTDGEPQGEVTIALDFQRRRRSRRHHGTEVPVRARRYAQAAPTPSTG